VSFHEARNPLTDTLRGSVDFLEAAEMPYADQGYYTLTAKGRDSVAAWFADSVDRMAPQRDELAIKIALAATLPDVDAVAVIRRQRDATLRALQDYSALRRAATGDVALDLVLELRVATVEAELRWLDYCEQELQHRGGPKQGGQTTSNNEPAARRLRVR